MIRNFEYLIVFTSAPGVLPEQTDRYRIQPWKVNEIKAYKKVHQQTSVGKVMLGAIFDCSEMVYQHVCSPKMRISKEYYKMVLERLIHHIQRKWLELLWQGVLIKTMLGRIWLLLCKKSLSTTTLKWWSIHYTARTPHHAVSGCFRHWSL